MGRFGTSWQLMKVSLGIVMAEKSLLIFPLISGILMIGIFISFFIGIFFTGFLDLTWMMAVMVFGLYLVSYFIAIYFNAALIGCATIKLNGGNPTVSDGFHLANQRIGKIFGWAVVSATVGLILQAVQERAGLLGKIVISLIGAAWSLATFFVVPVLLYEEHGVWASLKRSISLFKNTWGETFISSFGFGIFFFALALAGIVPIILGVYLFGFGGLLAGIIIAVIYWVILALIASAAQGVLLAALYRYATTGKVSPEYQHVASAWHVHPAQPWAGQPPA